MDRHGTTIPLGRASRRASRDQPGRRDGNVPAPAGEGERRRPYSVLLPVGFTLPPPLPEARGALTAPFHPCPPEISPRGRHATGGLFSVALSLGSPPPAVSRHRIPVEPGLSSIVSRQQRSSGRLADGTWTAAAAASRRPWAISLPTEEEGGDSLLCRLPDFSRTGAGGTGAGKTVAGRTTAAKTGAGRRGRLDQRRIPRSAGPYSRRGFSYDLDQ